MTRDELVQRRRAFKIEGDDYKTLSEVGFDGDFVTPYQIISHSSTGPVLIGYHWLDAPSFKEKRNQLTGTGYMPEMLFNKVLDQALAEAGLTRSDIYITQAFHLLPSTRSHKIPKDHLLRSFLEITRHELVDRQVIALGSSVAALCAHCQIHCQKVAHPSARGRTASDKAHELAEALKRATASAD